MRDFLIKLLTKKKVTQIKWEGTELAFTIKGKKYFRFTDIAKLPVTRFVEMQRCEIEMQHQISKREMKLFIEALELAHSDLVLGATNKVKGQALAKIGHYISEMKNRQELLLHPELMFEYATIQYVREDEDPTIYDPAFERHKQAEIKEAMQTDSEILDFFDKGRLENYLPVLIELKGDLNQHLSHYQREIDSLTQQLNSHISEAK
jgi:hypothetical protein